MANWKEPKIDYKAEDQVTPSIFNTLGENEKYLQEVKITTEQVQNAVVESVEATIRENLSANESIKTAFGKIRKLFTDLKSLAFADKVAASNVTGLSKVATSGDYNDLTNKPKEGATFKKVVCRLRKYQNFEKGIYLAFMRFKNNGGITNITCFGAISTGYAANGTYSSKAFFWPSGGDVGELEVNVGSDGSVSFELNSDKGDWDGSAQLILYKIGDLPAIDEDFEDETI